MDTLSNMLSAIKNAAMANKASLEVPYSKESEEVAKLMKEKGFLEEVKTFKEKGKVYKKLHLDLSYDDSLPRITQVKRISTPGRRMYTKSTDIRQSRAGYGLIVVSTSRGIMSGTEARRKKLGGELICEVY